MTYSQIEYFTDAYLSGAIEKVNDWCKNNNRDIISHCVLRQELPDKLISYTITITYTLRKTE